jgi:hypothetical protein
MIERPGACHDAERVPPRPVLHGVEPHRIEAIAMPVHGEHCALPECASHLLEQLRWRRPLVPWPAGRRDHGKQTLGMLGQPLELERALPFWPACVRAREQTAEIAIAHVIFDQQRQGRPIRFCLFPLRAGLSVSPAFARTTGMSVLPAFARTTGSEVGRPNERQLSADDQALRHLTRRDEGAGRAVQAVEIAECERIETQLFGLSDHLVRVRGTTQKGERRAGEKLGEHGGAIDTERASSCPTFS